MNQDQNGDDDDNDDDAKSEDTCACMLHLDGGAVSDSLVGVDALVELLAVKVLGEELLDLWDTRRATDKHNLMKTFRV